MKINETVGAESGKSRVNLMINLHIWLVRRKNLPKSIAVVMRPHVLWK